MRWSRSAEEGDSGVPNHLKDGNRDSEGFGHGEGYLYPHAYRDHWVAQQYLPTSLQGQGLLPALRPGLRGADSHRGGAAPRGAVGRHAGE
ncbi:AAA family ATPase [Nostocoides sp.]